MSINKRILFSIIAVASCILFFAFSTTTSSNADFITYEVDLQKQDLKLYWKDENNVAFKSILNLKNHLEKKQKKLLFAMNAGMYKPDYSPQGLFIQEQKTLQSIDTNSASGNFYWKPNGVFYVTTNHKAMVCKTENFKSITTVKYATQSGPMLVIDGNIHPEFKQGSTKLNIRNGVGILPNGNPVFVMSKQEINFYDFANYFKTLGCKNALYLDGFVSRTYLPEKNWIQTDGNFGVIIGVCKK
ncbi:MAG: phosphodiester glycosidase family protein [Chitinophagales bacterium]